jgi:hypothetical protein
VQKLKEKKVLADDGSLEVTTRITREQFPTSVSYEVAEERVEGPEGLGPQLWALHQQGQMTDYTLECEGRRLPCHRLVLAARSGFFRGLLTTGLAEEGAASHAVTDTDPATLGLLLEFLYTGAIREAPDLAAEEVRRLMHAADFYVVDGLKRRCEEWLLARLDTANMVDLLILGDTYHATRLRDRAKQMLLENSKKLNLITDWKEKLATR